MTGVVRANRLAT